MQHPAVPIHEVVGPEDVFPCRLHGVETGAHMDEVEQQYGLWEHKLPLVFWKC